MRKGTKGGLQFHHLKDEGGVVLEGELEIIYDDGNSRLASRICRPGDAFHFPPGAIHQGHALTDVVYLEASTPHFNDRVHAEHLYGLPEAGGLPSTSIEDVRSYPS